MKAESTQAFLKSGRKENIRFISVVCLKGFFLGTWRKIVIWFFLESCAKISKCFSSKAIFFLLWCVYISFLYRKSIFSIFNLFCKSLKANSIKKNNQTNNKLRWVWQWRTNQATLYVMSTVNTAQWETYHNFFSLTLPFDQQFPEILFWWLQSPLQYTLRGNCCPFWYGPEVCSAPKVCCICKKSVH